MVQMGPLLSSARMKEKSLNGLNQLIELYLKDGAKYLLSQLFSYFLIQ